MREGTFINSPDEELEALRNIQWPALKVDSREFGALAAHERLRQLALGYLASAKSLCTELGEQPSLLTWPRASVVCFCYRHAVELFLKSCILYRVRDIQKCSHDIASLQKQYRELYPARAFHVQTPWSLSLQDIEEAFGGRPDMEQFEEKQDQVYRYLSDKQGRAPKGLYNFAPGVWLWLIERLHDDIDRIWANIREAEGIA